MLFSLQLVYRNIYSLPQKLNQLNLPDLFSVGPNDLGTSIIPTISIERKQKIPLLWLKFKIDFKISVLHNLHNCYKNDEWCWYVIPPLMQGNKKLTLYKKCELQFQRSKNSHHCYSKINTHQIHQELIWTLPFHWKKTHMMLNNNLLWQ